MRDIYPIAVPDQLSAFNLVEEHFLCGPSVIGCNVKGCTKVPGGFPVFKGLHRFHIVLSSQTLIPIFSQGSLCKLYDKLGSPYTPYIVLIRSFFMILLAHLYTFFDARVILLHLGQIVITVEYVTLGKFGSDTSQHLSTGHPPETGNRYFPL